MKKIAFHIVPKVTFPWNIVIIYDIKNGVKPGSDLMFYRVSRDYFKFNLVSNGHKNDIITKLSLWDHLGIGNYHKIMVAIEKLRKSNLCNVQRKCLLILFIKLLFYFLLNYIMIPLLYVFQFINHQFESTLSFRLFRIFR